MPRSFLTEEMRNASFMLACTLSAESPSLRTNDCVNSYPMLNDSPEM